MAKRNRKNQQAERVPVDRGGDGPLRLPKGGVPCDFCRKPVTSLRDLVLPMEDEQGNEYWSGTHRRCERRRQETLQRKGKAA